MKEKSIRGKVIGSYFAIVALIAIILAMLWHERSVTMQIAAKSDSIRVVHNEISTVHHRITELAMRGETAMAWTDSDRQEYDSLLQETDSILKVIKGNCNGYVQPKMIDSISTLLYIKGQHLVDLMKMTEQHKERNHQLLSQLPSVAKRATEVKVEKRKKSGLAGLLGGKKNVTVVPSDKDRARLAELNDKIASRHEQRQKDIETFIDSLRRNNSVLNTKLSSLIVELDTQTQKAISDKKSCIEEARTRTLLILACISFIALIAIALLTLNIRRELRRRRKNREERERLISELKQSNDEKDEVIKTRRQIIQTVTHELRTPLTTIMGNAELITHKTTDETSINHAERIRESAIHMSDMTDSLLGYFRLDSMKETVVKNPFVLSTVVETLEADFKDFASKKNLTLEVIDDTDDVIVDNDREMLLRIGRNLLSNAIKYTDNGKVALRTSYKDGMFSMTVEDTGSGMDEEKKKNIFEPFVRLSNAASKQGFGLGLTIVKELVELLGGEITVESEKGKGSKFHVTIPMEIANEINDVGVPTISGNKITGIRSVIAIDDSDSNLNILKEMLSIYNIRCDTCKDVATLTRKLLDGNYDALVTDLRMDGLSGYDILHLLRGSSMEKLKEIPIVAMTAIDNSNEDDLLAEGFTACLFKPYSIADMVNAINRCAKTTDKELQPDFSSFIAYGDTNKKLSILIAETEEDIKRLTEAMATGDNEAMRSIIHKSGGTWMLLKVDSPLHALGNILKDANADKTLVASALETVITTGERIISKATEIKDGR